MVEELCCLVKDLQEEENRLCSVQGNTKDIDRLFSEIIVSRLSGVSNLQCSGEAGELRTRQDNYSKLIKDEGWKLVAACTRRKVTPPQDLTGSLCGLRPGLVLQFFILPIPDYIFCDSEAYIGRNHTRTCRSLRKGEVPEDWKKANVTPVSKKDKKEGPENYQPVRLTSIPGKVMEHLILEAIGIPMDDKMIRSSQHGFTKGKSCLANPIAFCNEETTLMDESNGRYLLRLQ
ncbi:hypothetical protein BTVI_71990 [Pitangus sulphuratus]|nr:hypothetical protein BTVI_71990 [Pitangus sulphuratus]